MTARVAWTKGGTGEIVAIDGDHVTLSSTISSPPGSLLDGRVNDTDAIRIKVRGCKRDGDAEPNRFRIDGRILDLSRQLRERLSTLVTRP